MKKQKIQNNISNIKAFTLVELIIVITILAVLSTIAFVSFQSFTRDARDTNRLNTLKSIETGLETNYAQSGNYPQADGILKTSTISGVTISKVGLVGNTVSKIIKLSPTPVDPLSGANYVYGSTPDGKYYQVATLLESMDAYIPTFNNTTYAQEKFKAKVIGNFKGYYIYNTGGVNYLSNIPSLIINNSGTTIDLYNDNPYFVVDKQNNLPFTFNGITDIGTVSKDDILKAKTGNTDAFIQEIDITSITDYIKLNTAFSGNILNNFGGTIDAIGQAIFADKYYGEIKPKAVLSTGMCNLYEGELIKGIWNSTLGICECESPKIWFGCPGSCDPNSDFYEYGYCGLFGPPGPPPGGS